MKLLNQLFPRFSLSFFFFFFLFSQNWYPCKTIFKTNLFLTKNYGIFGSPPFFFFFFKGHSFSPKSFSKKKNIVFTRKFPISSFAISKENFYLFFFLQKFKFETSFFKNCNKNHGFQLNHKNFFSFINKL